MRTALCASLCGLALLGLGGCATAPGVAGTLPGAAHTDPAFAVSGRIAVRYDGRADSGNFSWRHVRADDNLTLETPLGQTLAQLRRDAAGVQLELADGRRYQSPAVEVLSSEVLGWELPLSGLQYWIRGVPQPGFASESAVRGESYALTQRGWQIDYPEFTGPPAVPARMVLKRQGLEIRLAIHQWNFQP